MEETQQSEVQISINDDNVPAKPGEVAGEKAGGPEGDTGNLKCGRLTEWVRGSWNPFFIGVASLVLFFETVSDILPSFDAFQAVSIS